MSCNLCSVTLILVDSECEWVTLVVIKMF